MKTKTQRRRHRRGAATLELAFVAIPVFMVVFGIFEYGRLLMDWNVLNAAARASNRSVSQFVLDSALSRAEETLPDRRRFDLNTEQWEAFMAALDAPTRDTPRLRRLLQEQSIFDAAVPG